MPVGLIVEMPTTQKRGSFQVAQDGSNDRSVFASRWAICSLGPITSLTTGKRIQIIQHSKLKNLCTSGDELHQS
ncbi:hypothetical protein CARN8_440003 [mine drainage metagenome]|uniref:Uncharacterized protein n=1 Tax=mine drainage metagenome TaxID=410659 RepID=A0A3P3ZPS0_9ZZZZ